MILEIVACRSMGEKNLASGKSISSKLKEC